jgi:broad specificity phosphatase PhoE
VNVFAIRHGETAWSLSGQHTGTTDIPLTDNGRRLAERMRPALARETFALVLVSPMQRAGETCELAGLGGVAVIEPDLVEWNYGEYEGLTPKQIRQTAPDWLIFRDGCPGGEAPEQVGARVDRVIARARGARATSRCSRTATCSVCSRRAGSTYPRAAGSTSCSIPAL